MFGSLKMRPFAKGHSIDEFNSVYSEVGTTRSQSVIRIDTETNEPEVIEIKSNDDKDEVLLVQDRFGKYLRLTHQARFGCRAHKNDGDMHLFVF
jgi:hypothetical protein